MHADGLASSTPGLAPVSPGAAFWRAFSANRGAVAGLVIAVLLVACALFAPWLAPHSPLEQYRDAVLKPPLWLEGSDPRFLLGTDPVGRDLLSRLVFGARLSLGLGLVSVTLSLSLGVLLGLLAGYSRGWVDALVMRIADVLIALPALLLAIAVVAVIGPSLVNTMIAVAIVMLPHYVRLTRATVLQEREREYVLASRIAGAGPLRLMFSVILPNCAAPLIVQATLGFSTAILDAAALGFLGLGAQPPAAEWGAMLAGALEFIETAWWVTSLPGLAIFLTVLAFNLLGDGLRDALDPRLRQ